jgi:isoquinoline 1-oxidoreductase beta subunit
MRCGGFGPSATLHGASAVKEGMVEQSNFDTFPALRMVERPVVEVHIVPSRESPNGIGEPGLPPVAPAVANALYAATGSRIPMLPINPEMLKS